MLCLLQTFSQLRGEISIGMGTKNENHTIKLKKKWFRMNIVTLKFLLYQVQFSWKENLSITKTTCKIMMVSCCSDFKPSKWTKSEQYYFQIVYLHKMQIIKQHKSPHFHIIGVEQRTFITTISLLFFTFSYLLYFFFYGCPVQVTMEKN